jgi:hypothetical protein
LISKELTNNRNNSVSNHRDHHHHHSDRIAPTSMNINGGTTIHDLKNNILNASMNRTTSSGTVSSTLSRQSSMSVSNISNRLIDNDNNLQNNEHSASAILNTNSSSSNINNYSKRDGNNFASNSASYIRGDEDDRKVNSLKNDVEFPKLFMY